MSRLRRLKENKRKNTIKTTMVSLALALAIVCTQTVGIYALFKDTEDVTDNLTISTGDVDVEVSEGLNFTDVQPGDVIKIPVKITNKGTLNQNISLDLSIPDEIKSYLKPKFGFGDINIKDGVMYNDTKLFVLAPGSSITGSIDITIAEMDKGVQNSLAGKVQNVNLSVKSTQTNKANDLSNNGFYDVAIQKNTIRVAQREIITINTGEKAYFTGGKGNSFEKLYVPVNVKGTNNEFELSATVSSATGTVKYEAKYYKYGDKDYILIQPTGNNPMEFKGVVNITIKVDVKKDGNLIESYELKCNATLKNAGNDCDDANHPDHGVNGKCHGEVVYDGHKTILYLLEETKPESMEILDQRNEEIEMKTETDTIKPSSGETEKTSELEIIECPKVEPIQPDVIEPSKEEIETQE
ncbi:MAG: TasA family protein [Paraclostridium sp.]